MWGLGRDRGGWGVGVNSTTLPKKGLDIYCLEVNFAYHASVDNIKGCALGINPVDACVALLSRCVIVVDEACCVYMHLSHEI